MKITIAENEKQFDEIAAWRIIGQRKPRGTESGERVSAL